MLPRAGLPRCSMRERVPPPTEGTLDNTHIPVNRFCCDAKSPYACGPGQRPVGSTPAAVSGPTLIKKYGNRRLYDTGESRYITLDELSKKIQSGSDVRVVDAKSGEDLTQATLTQIIIEGRGAARMLPVPLLIRLIRLGDDTLAEFFGQYVADALEIYLQMKRGASRVVQYNPFATMPLAATDALARMWMGAPFGVSRASEPSPVWRTAPAEEAEAEEPPATPPVPERAGHSEELAQLRRELDELKRSMQRGAEPPRRQPRKRKPR